MEEGETTITAELGEEWAKASCTGPGCDRQWEGRGTLAARRVIDRAQKHSNRTGHVIDLQHANAR